MTNQAIRLHAQTHLPDGPDPITFAVTIQLIYVGTMGVDGVDAYLLTNPHPYAPGDTPGPPPFEDSWTDSLGGFLPVAFAIDEAGFVYIQGAFYGGADGTTVFTLPSGFRPAGETSTPACNPTGATIGTCNILSTGEFVYVSAVP